MKALLACAALVALSLSGAAAAQTGRSGMSTSERAEHINAYRELQLLGICYARTQRRSAVAVMVAAQGSREENEILRRTFFGETATCNSGGNMEMSTVFARGAIAEGLLQSGGMPAENLRPAPAPAQVRDLSGAGLCFASGRQAQIRALLTTRPGSAEENAAVTALWQDFRTCIPGFRIRLNAIWIRYILAEGLLMLAPGTAAPASPAPSAN